MWMRPEEPKALAEFEEDETTGMMMASLLFVIESITVVGTACGGGRR